jgi:chloramphenicol-sensitive protein RarD
LSTSDPQRAGIRAGVAAYAIWGLLTLYWKELTDFAAAELIGWRILAAALTMAVVVTARGGWRNIAAAFADGTTRMWVLLAAVLLTGNWGSYVYAVVNDRIIETALGYFIAPLGTMAIGIVVLGERPSRAQKLAMGFALAAVVELTLSYGEVPWMALIIAVSWSFYGLCKRNIPLTGVESFAAESFTLVIPAAVTVIVFAGRANSVPQSADAAELVLVSLSGIATAVPLVLFAFAAARVPFTVLGPLQFLVPIINFLLGWLVYDEPLPWERLVGFGLVWVALVLVTFDRARNTAPAAPPAVAQPAPVGSAGS